VNTVKGFVPFSIDVQLPKKDTFTLHSRPYIINLSQIQQTFAACPPFFLTTKLSLANTASDFDFSIASWPIVRNFKLLLLFRLLLPVLTLHLSILPHFTSVVLNLPSSVSYFVGAPQHHAERLLANTLRSLQKLKELSARSTWKVRELVDFIAQRPVFKELYFELFQEQLKFSDAPDSKPPSKRRLTIPQTP